MQMSMVELQKWIYVESYVVMVNIEGSALMNAVQALMWFRYAANGIRHILAVDLTLFFRQSMDLIYRSNTQNR